MDETKNLSENEGTKPPTEGSGGSANRRSGQNQVHQLTSFLTLPDCRLTVSEAHQ